MVAGVREAEALLLFEHAIIILIVLDTLEAGDAALHPFLVTRLAHPRGFQTDNFGELSFPAAYPSDNLLR